MSQNVNQAALEGQTKQLMDGPLKHIRAAALAAALVPLASVFAAPASAQAICPSGGACGTVFNDVNGNGIYDTGDTPLAGVEVTVVSGPDEYTVFTDNTGFYSTPFPVENYTASIVVPTGTQASPPNVGSDNTDSDGVTNGGPVSSAGGTLGTATDFGFVPSASLNPGTGTPGYWKNHPTAWPVSSITVGGHTYTKAQAIAILGKVGKDKAATMFSSLVPAMLNVMIGNESSCVAAYITAGDAWLATYVPLGVGISPAIAASSYAWSVGEPIHQTLDAYNNGQLCAPHRN
jgi:hypothetical protein